jgi:phage baseplate assembly protein W
MPLSQITRVDPQDLEPNTAIGTSLPFNAGSVFKSTYSRKSQIKSNLINLLLTRKGERINNIEFGCNFTKLLFEQLSDSLLNQIKEEILISINTYIPDIIILGLEIIPNFEGNSVTAMVSYKLKISGTKDEVYIDFSTL